MQCNLFFLFFVTHRRYCTKSPLTFVRYIPVTRTFHTCLSVYGVCTGGLYRGPLGSGCVCGDGQRYRYEYVRKYLGDGLVDCQKPGAKPAYAVLIFTLHTNCTVQYSREYEYYYALPKGSTLYYSY